MRKLRDKRQISCLKAFIELATGLVKQLDQIDRLNIQLDIAGTDLRCLNQIFRQLLQSL